MSYLRRLMLACFMSLWLAMSALASQDKLSRDLLPSHVRSEITDMSGESADHNSYSEELWLLGSFLVSLAGMIIFVRLINR